jgi:hypothetical protein
LTDLELAKSRFELKYRINFFTYLKIKNALHFYMKKDKFTRTAPGKGYLVRSLYFDSNDLSAYHEKMSGDNERIKFRLRTYNSTLHEKTLVRVELKARRNNLVIKKSDFVDLENYLHFIKYKHWKNHTNQTMIEFERYLHMKSLEPKIITQYYREGYETRTKDSLRITFDHDVQSTHADSLFPKHCFYNKHGFNTVILEIKFKDEPPGWVRKLVFENGLKVLANSKFTQGIQIARKDLHHPGGVVIVR